MRALIVIESCFGNTEHVGQRIADALRSAGYEVDVVAAAANISLAGVDLLVLGAPTHMRRLPTPRTRASAVERGGTGPAFGIAEFLATAALLPPTAAFATVSGPGVIPGSAAKDVQRRIRRRRMRLLARAEFIVTATAGPLEDGELDRSAVWGLALADQLAAGRN